MIRCHAYCDIGPNYNDDPLLKALPKDQADGMMRDCFGPFAGGSALVRRFTKASHPERSEGGMTGIMSPSLRSG